MLLPLTLSLTSSLSTDDHVSLFTCDEAFGNAKLFANGLVLDPDRGLDLLTDLAHEDGVRGQEVAADDVDAGASAEPTPDNLIEAPIAVVGSTFFANALLGIALPICLRHI